MMKTCNLCSEWAQWRVRKPTRDGDGKITGWELIALLCGVHKKEQEKMPENEKLKFEFCGAVCR